MVTRIKRIAQFLFDNADAIEKVLRQSNNYRALHIDIAVFKHYKEPKLDIELTLYDEETTHRILEEEAINPKDFRLLCRQLNKETGVEKYPKPAKVRKKL